MKKIIFSIFVLFFLMLMLSSGDAQERSFNSVEHQTGEPKDRIWGSKDVAQKYIAENKKSQRRICAQIAYLECKNLQEVEWRIKELKDSGVNTILFRVFHNKGDRFFQFAAPRYDQGVYFKTDQAPVVDDLLEKVAEIAHRHGLDIFAWMTTRYASYGLEGHPEYRCKGYNFKTKKVELTEGLNLFHPEVLKHLEGLFRDLGRYSIDGILFQDDLKLRHVEDFSDEANQAFAKEFGYLPQPTLFYIDPYQSDSGKYYVKGYTDPFWIWAKWKNRWLMQVARRLMEAAKESNPKLKFAINIHLTTIMNESNGIAWFSQSLSEALKTDFDYYAIMAYHRQAMKDNHLNLQEVTDLIADTTRKTIRTVGDPSKVMIKLWILENNEKIGSDVVPQKELEAILAVIRKQGEVSLAFVPYTGLLPLRSFKEQWNPSK